MSDSPPRLRMFAGPNGSGKSTLKTVLPIGLLGECLNADDIEQRIRQQGFLIPSDYGVESTGHDLLSFLRESKLLDSNGFGADASMLRFGEGKLLFGSVQPNSYFASAVSEYLRMKLMEKRRSFTLETVMSHSSKVELLSGARLIGYRTYLYYVATADPAINVSRVRNRVKLGGHSVPEDRIVSRYHRSLSLLMDAIRSTNRAYIFDNSGENLKHTLLAEITDGRDLEMRAAEAPAWFRRAVLDKLDGQG